MLRTIFWIGLAVSSLSALGFNQQHTKWAEVLKKYQVEDGRVMYRVLKEEWTKAGANHPLALYLNEISLVGKVEFESWTREQKMAFLINSYNALTWKLVNDAYPVKSIKDVGGLFKSPWKKEFFSLLGGNIKSLDPIEHDYLRLQYKDPRVHAALNCASMSCPRLQNVPFLAANLEAQLEGAFREFLADPRRNRYDESKGGLYLSKIFDWFEKDFPGGIIATFSKWGPEAARNAVAKGGYYEFQKYDWALNDANAEEPQVASRPY